jgi:flagellar biosynthesis/type III secretory pathway chaperone
MSAARRVDPFAALVREFELELLHLRQMLALAAEEQRDLVAGEMTRLDAISAEKLAQLRALEHYGVQRASWLAELGFADDERGLAACALAAGSRGWALLDAWRRVADALADLRELTVDNRLLLRARLAALLEPVPPAAGLAPVATE